MQQSTPQVDGSNDDNVVVGKPSTKPPRVIDFEELDKKTIDILVDALKYIATTCGIVIAVYSQSLREYIKEGSIPNRANAKLLLFSPLIFWFASIIATVMGILPREYFARTDLEKELVIRAVRRQKRFWLRAALLPFVVGFGLFLFVLAAQIWRLPPFRP